jgi:hypothetical protein
MAKRKEPVDVVEETTEVSEQSRRDFIAKMVTAAGVVAAAGLAAQGADALEFPKVEAAKVELNKDPTLIKWGKLSNGFRLTLSGAQIGQALQGAGVLTKSAKLENAKITIEFSA